MNDYFHFKKFHVSHKRSSMKVGTDAVLLGAWVDPGNASTILDVGTGAGVIALMLAQRCADTLVDAVEINNEAYLDASENFERSPWKSRLRLYQTSIQNFRPKKRYDLIVSNPPYFVKSLKPPDVGRQHARHTDSLSFDELIRSAIELLQPNGRLAVVLPSQEAMIFEKLAAVHHLFCKRKCAFRTRAHKPVERSLMEFSTQSGKMTEEELCLYSEGSEWSPGYRTLTKEFYLNA